METLLGLCPLEKDLVFVSVFEDLLFTVQSLPYPHTWRGDKEFKIKEQKVLDYFTKIIDESGHEIAALIIEPLVQGAGGMRFCRPEFMREIVRLAQDNNILVIFDEVAVGFGRTGSLFACEKIGCQPDLICLSKGLTSGYMPMSVTVATETIYNAFKHDDFSYAFFTWAFIHCKSTRLCHCFGISPDL